MIPVFALLFSGLAFADPTYLTPFLGSYRVVDRACDLSDPICTSATNLALIRNADQGFTLIETNGSAVLVQRTLLENSSGATSSYITGEDEPPMEAGWWTVVHDDSAGHCEHSETASFEEDTSFSQPRVTYTYETDDNVTRKVNRREYVLERQ
jgi:hypothetical protein